MSPHVPGWHAAYMPPHEHPWRVLLRRLKFWRRSP